MSGISYGSSTDDNFNISVTVDPFCEITNPINDVNVDYNPFKVTNFAVGTIDFRCIKGTPFTLSATSSHNPSGPLGRMLKDDNPAYSIDYSLSATVNYGSSSAHSLNLFASPISMTAPTWDPPSTFYVAISFGGQPVPTGTYTDTITINISY
ncbi:MAG: spore coat protein U domain-containing protein [Persephonella sp.]|nr:spore coat protein U domain-containing protein [Persephonella sp.]